MKYKRRIVKRETFKQVATLAKLSLPRRISTFFAESGQKKSESNGIITQSWGKKKKDE